MLYCLHDIISSLKSNFLVHYERMTHFMTLETIERINALSRKQRSTGLTEEEKQEQLLLRRQYIDNIKIQITQALGQDDPTAPIHEQ